MDERLLGVFLFAGKTGRVPYPKKRQVAVNTKSLTLGQAFGESEAMLQQGGSAGILAAGLCEGDVLRALAPDKKGRYAERYRQVADTLSSEANPVLFLYYPNGRL